MKFVCLLLALPGLCAAAEVQVGGPAPPLTLNQVLQAPALEKTFQVKAHKESGESQVFLLKRRADMEPTLRPATTASTRWWGTAGDRKAISAPTSFLADIASQALRTPVSDETGMQGRFDFELKWEAGNPASFVSALRDQLRLELVRARRPLEYLVVDSAIQPRGW